MMTTREDRALVPRPGDIRLAMIGMVEGNGHPFSWSVILNGDYDRQAIAQGGYPGICAYLDAQPRDALGLPGARVTHVCCDEPAQSARVARAAGIAHVAASPQEVIGQVDAVIIATDLGSEHVARARPFIEAGLPVFIDKPLADNPADLAQFIDWRRQGHVVLSSSGMRYACEWAALRGRMHEVGTLRAVQVTMCKSWERYGIHAVECAYGFLPPGGWAWVASTADAPDAMVHARHDSGVDVTLLHRPDLLGSYGHVTLVGTQGVVATQFRDTFHAFKAQMQAFLHTLRTGQEAHPFSHTAEQVAVVIAGIESGRQGGRRVAVDRDAWRDAQAAGLQPG